MVTVFWYKQDTGTLAAWPRSEASPCLLESFWGPWGLLGWEPRLGPHDVAAPEHQSGPASRRLSLRQGPTPPPLPVVLSGARAS